MQITRQTFTVILAVTLLASGVEAAELSAPDDGNNRIPELDCIIEPSEIVDVGSAVPGVVESILADRNDQVTNGTIIARLESSVERATLELSRERANLNTAIDLREEGARFGRLTQNRNRSLLQTAAISKHELDAVVSETRIAELQVIQERDNKRIAGLELLRAEAVLDRRTIRSPVDGVVVDRFKAAGEYIDDEPVMRVAQLDPLHVEVIVSTDYLGRIKPGMQAQVTPIIPEADTYLATVERVDQVSDAASGTYGVRLTLANPDYKIPAGLRCRLGFVPLHRAGSAQVAAETGATVAKPDDGPSEQANMSVEKAPDSAGPDSVEAAAAVSKPQTTGNASEQMDVPVEKAPDSADPVSVEAIPVVSEPELVSDSSEQADAPVDRESDSAESAAVEAIAAISAINPVSQESKPDSYSCHVIGPFMQERLARQWFDGLQKLSANLTLRDEKVSVEESYMVYSAADPNEESVRELLFRLDKAGISDRYVFTRGERKGQISLGVYSYRNGAEKRQRILADSGFNTEIAPRYKQIRQYWLDLAMPPAGKLPSTVGQLPANTSIQAVACIGLLARR